MPGKQALQDDSKTNGDAATQPRLDILKKLRIVIRSAQRHSQWIEKQCGVSGAQLWMMQELHDHPGLRVGELAARLAIHQTTASNLVDALRKLGYVVKVRDEVDQRVVKLALTDEGIGTLAKAPKPARGLLPEAILHLDEASLAQLDQGLQGLLKSIGHLDEAFGLMPMPFSM